MASTHEMHSVSHFEIVRKLGEGGMGVVYQARDTDLGRYVALKFLPPELVSSPERIARFRQEARAISTLNHPRIATIYGIEETGDLEVPGAGVSARRHAAAEAFGAQVFRRDALAAPMPGMGHPDRRRSGPCAQARNRSSRHQIVQRAVYRGRPTQDRRLRAGQDRRGSRRRPKRHSTSGRAMGTPVYMSPEQARGQEVDERSDIFSLGILLFELIAGEMPFRNTDTPAVLHDIAYTPAPPLGAFRDGVPDDASVGDFQDAGERSGAALPDGQRPADRSPRPQRRGAARMRRLLHWKP